MYLIFDTETTGLPQNWKAPLTDFDNWPRMVQIAWQMHDEKGVLIDVKNFLIQLQFDARSFIFDSPKSF